MEACDPTTSAPQAWEEIAQDRGRRRKEKNDDFVPRNGSNITCGVCDRSFPETQSQETFDRHLYGHHGLIDLPEFVSCPTCYRFMPRGEIKNHVIREHSDDSWSIFNDKTVEILDFTNKISWIKADEEGKITDGQEGYIHKLSLFKPCLESKTTEDLRKRIRLTFHGGDSTALFLFKTKQSKQWPLNWVCSLCPEENSPIRKYRNDISMRVFALRHLKEHCEDVNGLEELITKEWKLLKKELREEIEVHFESDRDLTQIHRSVDYYVKKYSVPLRQLAYELVRRGKQKMLPQALSLCLVCCNPVFGQLAQHFKAEHPELHAHGEISEFRKVEEAVLIHRKDLFVFDLLSYTQLYKMKDSRSSSSVTFFKWKCIIPCDDEAHTHDSVEFPSINILRLYALKHFDTFHHKFFRQKFMDREWKLVQNDIHLPFDFISYNPEIQSGFALNDPNSFCLPFVNKMMPKAVSSNEYKICGFCFWCGFKKEFLKHIRQHNYVHTGEYLAPNAALESSAESVVKKLYITQDPEEPVKKIVGASARKLVANLFPSDPEQIVGGDEDDVKPLIQKEDSDERGVGDVKPFAEKQKSKKLQVEEAMEIEENRVTPVESIVDLMVDLSPPVDITEDTEEVEKVPDIFSTIEETPVVSSRFEEPDLPATPAFNIEPPKVTTRVNDSDLDDDSDMITDPNCLEEFSAEPEDGVSNEVDPVESVEQDQEHPAEVVGLIESQITIGLNPYTQDLFSSRSSEREKTPILQIVEHSPKTPIEETPKKLTAMETIENAIVASLDQTLETRIEAGIDVENIQKKTPYSTPCGTKGKGVMNAVAKTEEQLLLTVETDTGDSSEDEDGDDTDTFEGSLKIVEEEEEDDMVVPKLDRSFTGTPCSSRTAVTPIQNTPNIAEIPFDWRSRVIGNFKYDGEEPALTPDVVDVVQSLINLKCPICKTALKRPSFEPGPSRDEETVLAHLLLRHADKPIARTILNLKRCKLRDNPDDPDVHAHIFLLDPDKPDLICSSCCEYTSKRLYNLRMHFVKCVTRDKAQSSPTVAPTPKTRKTPRSTGEMYNCSLNCKIRWKQIFRCSPPVSEVVHLITRHFGQKAAYEAALKLSQENSFADSFPFLDFPASWEISGEKMKLVCSKCKVKVKTISELVKHADKNHKEVESDRCPLGCTVPLYNGIKSKELCLVLHVMTHLPDPRVLPFLRSQSVSDRSDSFPFNLEKSIDSAFAIDATASFYVCSKCGEDFCFKQFRRHLRSGVCHPEFKRKTKGDVEVKVERSEDAIECPVCEKKLRSNKRYPPQASIFFHILGYHLRSDEGEDALRAMNAVDFRHMPPHIGILPTLEDSKELEGNSYSLVCAFCESRSASLQTHEKHLESHEHLLKCSMLEDPCDFCGQLIPRYGSGSNDFFVFAHLLEYHLGQKKPAGIFENLPESIVAPSISVKKSLKKSREASSPVFCCSQCPFTTNSSLIFLHHFDEHHCPDKLDPAKTYFCPECKKNLNTSSQYSVRVSLLIHFLGYHKDSKDIFENTWGLEWSGKEFPFLNAAKSFEEKKFVCNACDCRFIAKNGALTHSELHHATTNTPNQTPSRKRQSRNFLIQDVFKKPRLDFDDSVLEASHYDSDFEIGADENIDTTQRNGDEKLGGLDTVDEEGMKSFLAASEDETLDDEVTRDLFDSPKSKTASSQDFSSQQSTSSSKESNKRASWLGALMAEDVATTSPDAKSQDLPSTPRVANSQKRLKGESKREKRPKSKNIHCSACKEKFPNREELFAHIKQDHAEDDSSYWCLVCKKRFSKRKQLRQHEFRIHEKPNMTTTSADSTLQLNDDVENDTFDSTEQETQNL